MVSIILVSIQRTEKNSDEKAPMIVKGVNPTTQTTSVMGDDISEC